jgi:hypothetical protein
MEAENMKKNNFLLVIIVLLLQACGDPTSTLISTIPTTSQSSTTTPVSTSAPALPPTATWTAFPTKAQTQVPTATPAATPAPLPDVISPELAMQLIATKNSQVIQAIKNKDMVTLSTFVDPIKGLRFSPYSYVSKNDVVIPLNKVKTLMTDKTVYHWGIFDGSGKPIDMTFERYYIRFVYSHDFANAPQKGFNRIIGRGNTIENSAEFYRQSIVVEYHFPGFEKQYEGLDWKSLRLVYQHTNNEWYLVGIIHDEWTI